jgi:hypothetical protein
LFKIASKSMRENVTLLCAPKKQLLSLAQALGVRILGQTGTG